MIPKTIWIFLVMWFRVSRVSAPTCMSFQVLLGSWKGYQCSHTVTTVTCESESLSVVSNPLQPHGPYSPWNSLGQNTGVGSLSLLQGSFLTQGLDPGLLHCRQILHQLSHKGSPGILEWVDYPFSSGSSRPRNCKQRFVS